MPSSPTPADPYRRNASRHLRWALLALGVVAGLVAISSLALPDVLWASIVNALLRLALVGVVLILILLAVRRLLWRVSGRLALSYFLIGVLPIPLVALILAVVAQILAGFFLGHLSRDALRQLGDEVDAAAAHGPQLAGRSAAEPSEARSSLPLAWATYRGGRKVSGDPLAPEAWPEWLAEATTEAAEGEEGSGTEGSAPEGDGAAAAVDRESSLPLFVALPDGRVTLASLAVSAPGQGTLAFLTEDLGELLRRRSRMWVNLYPNLEGRESIELTFGGTSMNARIGSLSVAEQEAQAAARERFFAARSLEDGSLLDRPSLSWLELVPAARRLDDGSTLGKEMPVTMTASYRFLGQNLFSPSVEIGNFFWIALLILSLTLLTIYAIAELVAVAMIFSLGRSVGQLHDATSQVSRGDFSARIPVRRKDQLGALQADFNAMAENLQDLVATAAQKELLDKELQIAREVQRSLIPESLPKSETLELATLFEPSAAIGGDYFDVLALTPDRVAVMVADVSGHGLPTGLRMAMVKAAFQVLVGTGGRGAGGGEDRESPEGWEPESVLRQLDALVRADTETRFFVTATLALVDTARGRLEIWNAGHPPTYRLRPGEPTAGEAATPSQVEEIVLPSSPLGGLGQRYGHRAVELAPGDVVVWLSDGLIEALDEDDQVFGYDRVREALAAGGCRDVRAVRDRLLQAVTAHTGGRLPDDDLTLVVLGYRLPPIGPSPPEPHPLSPTL